MAKLCSRCFVVGRGAERSPGLQSTLRPKPVRIPNGERFDVARRFGKQSRTGGRGAVIQNAAGQTLRMLQGGSLCDEPEKMYLRNPQTLDQPLATMTVAIDAISVWMTAYSLSPINLPVDLFTRCERRQAGHGTNS